MRIAKGWRGKKKLRRYEAKAGADRCGAERRRRCGQVLCEICPSLRAGQNARSNRVRCMRQNLGRVKRLERSNASAEIRRLVVQTTFKRRSNDVQTFRALSNGAKRGKNKAPFQGQMQTGLDLNSDLDLDSGASLRGGGGRESRCCCCCCSHSRRHRRRRRCCSVMLQPPPPAAPSLQLLSPRK